MSNNNNTTKFYALKPTDSHKSFYGKAIVVTYAVSGDDVNGGGSLVDRSDFGFRVAVGLWFWVR